MEFSSERKRKNQVVAHNLRSTHSAQAPAQRLRARARCYRGAQVWVAATAITRGGREKYLMKKRGGKKKTNNKKIRKTRLLLPIPLADCVGIWFVFALPGAPL